MSNKYFNYNSEIGYKNKKWVTKNYAVQSLEGQ